MTYMLHPDFGRCAIINSTPCGSFVTVKIVKTGYITAILRRFLLEIPKTDITD